MDFIAPEISDINFETYMELALQEAVQAGLSGEIPIGAIIVINEEIISRGRASHQKNRSQLCHAELNAMLDGGERLWKEYKHAILYTTVEPCPLCLGAVVMADIPHIIFSLHDKNVFSALTVETNPYVRRHIKSYHGGVLAEQSAAILAKYDPKSLKEIQESK